MSENLNPLKRLSYKEQVSRSITWGHYFIFLNILLACLLGFSYVYAAPPTNNLLSFFYLIVTWLGHLSFLTVVVYLVVFFPLAFIGNFRYYRVLCVVIAVIAHTILLFDIKIYLLVKVHLSITAINLIVRELDFDTGLNYNFLFIAVPVVIALECFFAKITTHSLYRAHHPYFVRTVLIVVGSCFISSHVLHIWADATNYERITLLRSTFPAHYPMTARSFLSSHGWINEKQLSLEGSSGAEFLKYPLSKLEFDHEALKEERVSNVLLISFNGLSYSNVTPETSPQLYAFGQQVDNYTQHYLLYPEELNNVFATNYGLPLQYRNALLSEQTTPVVIDEMLRQDYVSRLIVSALPHTPQAVTLALDGMGFTNRADYHNFQPNLVADSESHDAVQDQADSEASVEPDGQNGQTGAGAVDGTTAPAEAATTGLIKANADGEFSAEEQETLNRYFNFLMQNAGLRSMQFSHAQDVNGVFTQALGLIEAYHHNEHRPFALNLVINDLRDFTRNPMASAEQVEHDPQSSAMWVYEHTLKQVDQAFGEFMQQLQAQGLLHNTLVIVTANEGNRLLPYSAQHFDRERQHVPLMVMWPQNHPEQLVFKTGSEHNPEPESAAPVQAQQGISCDQLTSPWDISATIARNVLHITTPSGNFTLGGDISSCPLRDYLIADGKDELVLIERKDNIIYSYDGSSYVERQGERLQVRPNLENLIESMRDLNRFLR